MTNQATKYDEGKVQLSMCPPDFFDIIITEYSSQALISASLLEAAHAKNLVDFEVRLKEATRFVREHLFSGDGWSMYHGLARVLEYGCKKYSRNNWKSGFKYSRLLDAALRHTQFAKDIDEESGLPHKYHITFCLAVLLDQVYKGTGENDITVDVGE